jgi:VanZ family protein
VIPSRATWLALWVVISGLVSVLYLLPYGGPPSVAQIDKLAHLAAFAAIGIATWPATQRSRAFGQILLVSAALAIGLECLQTFVPGRDFSFFDLLANTAGLAIGAIAGRRLENVLTRPVELRRPR